MISEEQIRILAEECLDGSSSYLLEVKVRPGNAIVVTIDSDSLVGIDDCVRLSRFIESRLDRESEDFELQVTSAGIDTPLRLVRQYRKNIGRDLLVELEEETVKGRLTEVQETAIKIRPYVKKGRKEIETEERTLQLGAIKKAKIIIKF